MNLQAQPVEYEFGSLLQQQGRKELLRFIACGSVDHGKSTLIGRLLYESKQLFEDQLDALAIDSRKFGT
jgi:sulfate adenylyltransferase subunit 1 (EFTu-like GTPase family)